jgi:hypothetical protein
MDGLWHHRQQTLRPRRSLLGVLLPVLEKLLLGDSGQAGPGALRTPLRSGYQPGAMKQRSVPPSQAGDRPSGPAPRPYRVDAKKFWLFLKQKKTFASLYNWNEFSGQVRGGGAAYPGGAPHTDDLGISDGGGDPRSVL